MIPVPKKKIGPLLESKQYRDVKDPCPVFDGRLWHKYGSGGDVTNEKWKIFHAIATSIEGPWEELPAVEMVGLSGDHVAAPGMVYENGIFHMFVQTEFTNIGGVVEYLTSDDGMKFVKQTTTIVSIPNTDEAGIYDPHPAVIGGEKYLVYAAMPEVRKDGRLLIQPNVFLAKSESNTWAGPWHRLGKILDHSHIEWHHNQYDHPEYEWGIEGPQLIELPTGRILLNATCFLPSGEFGTRQRVFFATAAQPTGPFKTMGPVLDPELDEWGNGENGHAAALMHEDSLHLFYQARPRFSNGKPNNWQYGMAVYSPEEFEEQEAENRI